MDKKVVRCMICRLECTGEEAEEHRKQTGHNNFELLIPVIKK